MRSAVFRADASVEIASGHVQRCLTLADALKASGLETRFVSRDLPGHLFDVIRQRGHSLTPLPGVAGGEQGRARGRGAAGLAVPWQVDARDTKQALGPDGPCDWLIVDHYGLGRRWEQALRDRVKRILVIDDLAQEPHDCDAVLNEALWPGMEERYDALVPRHARRLLGPRFALVRDVFREIRAQVADRDGGVSRILISYGGVDATNETSKALTALAKAGRPGVQVDVVIGAANPHRATIAEAVSRHAGATLHIQLPHLANLMSRADLALSAGGSTLIELLCAGVPALITTTAENQVRFVRALHDDGAIRWIGSTAEVGVDVLTRAITEAFERPDDLRRFSKAGRALIDGKGVERIVAAVSDGPGERPGQRMEAVGR